MERKDIFMGAMVALLIFLTATLCLAVAGYGQSRTADLWSFTVNDSMPWTSMYVGDDGTFYTTAGNAIEAIGTDGSVKWSLPLDYRPETISGLSDDRNRVFLTVFSGTGPFGRGGELLAVSQEGQALWRLPIQPMGPAPIAVAGDRLFKYTENRNLGAYDCGNGSLLWSVYTSKWAPVVDLRGNLYVEYDEYNVTSDSFIGELRSYDPDGRLRWAHNFSDYGIDYREIGYGRLRALNDTLLMTDGFGVAAADFNGTFLWHRETGYRATIYDIDAEGGIYMIRWNETVQTSRNPDPATRYPDFEVIRPNGSIQRVDGRKLANAMGEFNGIRDGIAYYARVAPMEYNRTQDDLDVYDLYAYDLGDARVCWTQRIAFSPTEVTLNASNVDSIMTDNVDIYRARKYNNATSENWYEWMDPETPGLKNRSDIRVVDGSDVAYVVYWAYNFEYPAIFNQSTCTYAGGICTVDDGGRLMWSRSTDSYVTSVTEKNGTVYYKTYNGRFSAASVDVAAGFVLATVYLFFRFFVLGAVARARTRLDQNRNRTAVLDFIARSPGATLYDLAKGLGMNIGTVRYHLLILSANHRIKACRDRGKHVRYFVNRGEYSDDEMLVLSLLRREHMGRLLYILMTSPGVQNVEISRATGLHESAVSRYLRELADRGIVEKRRVENGRLSYALEARYRDAITRANLPVVNAIACERTEECPIGGSR